MCMTSIAKMKSALIGYISIYFLQLDVLKTVLRNFATHMSGNNKKKLFF